MSANFHVFALKGLVNVLTIIARAAEEEKKGELARKEVG